MNIKIVANEVLRSHNAYRRTHGSPDLHLDDQMICDAQKYAEDIAFKGVLKHIKNIFSVSSAESPPRDLQIAAYK